jgi:DNA-directed RNA polymerase subunit beta
MVELIQNNFRLRKNFGKIENLVKIPNLLETQKNSFKKFLDVESNEFDKSGLHDLFKSIFPVSNNDETVIIDYLGFTLDEPKYDVNECRYRGATYSIPLKVGFELTINDKISDSDKLQPKSFKRQEVYFGEIPIMTKESTFVINGTERIIVTQLHRSPGLSYIKDTASVTKKASYLAKIIPAVGSWLVFEFDSKEICYVQIDTKRKLPVTTFLKALKYTNEDIVNYFYDSEEIILRKKGKDIKLYKEINFNHLLNKKIPYDFKDKDGNIIVKASKKLNERNLNKIKEAGIKEILVEETAISYFAYNDIVAKDGTLMKHTIEEIVEEDIAELYEKGIKRFPIIYFNQVHAGSYIKDTMFSDKIDDFALREIAYCVQNKIRDDEHEGLCSKLKFDSDTELEEFVSIANSYTNTIVINQELKTRFYKLVYKHIGKDVLEDEMRKQSLKEIFRRMRPNEPATYKDAEQFLDDILFKPGRYDLSDVGRMKFNTKLSSNEYRNELRNNSGKPAWTPPSMDVKTLRREDIIETIKYLVDIKNNGYHNAKIDDIDHLSNRRVRAVGELISNEIKKGLLKIKKTIDEKMSSATDIDLMSPHELINPKPLHATLNEFFGSSQLSQFMDQTNPLSEITHKRRLSALGPSGLKRERAGYEVRDVHATHYGRICPIETPEGQNIGLISSLAMFTKIDDYGFLESPYRKIENGKLMLDYKYLSTIEEEDRIIAQAEVKFDSETLQITDEHVYARKNGDFLYVKPDEVDWMDISTYQMVSVAAAMIPFLQNDDANRALMGSNMQRQAVPLLKTDAPFIGTGIEETVAKDSGVAVLAERGGIVEYVDSTRIVVKVQNDDESVNAEADIYNLQKYRRSNQNTCINQIPVVRKGDYVKENDILADGPATDMGEIALGKNLLVAFMPWHGYNYEDAILISERVVKEDVFTSIHIEEEEVLARDVKLGPENITRDVPGAREENLGKLDESGIIKIGAIVRQDDILVGKITPRAEKQLTPEERLLRAIFGSKADDVQDTSLRVSHGISGIVIDVKVFTRKGIEKNSRSIEIEKYEEKKLRKDARDRKQIIQTSIFEHIDSLLIGKEVVETVFKEQGKRIVSKGDILTKELLSEFNSVALYLDLKTNDRDLNARIKTMLETLKVKLDKVEDIYKKKLDIITQGDELTPGVRKMVKVILAIKRKLQVGDKMSGRHGNKGVVSTILAEEDLPYLPDGTPVDMVLNPLGVPSRMNIGQILEVHLGWAAKGLGEKLYKMYKEGSSIPEMQEFLYKIYDRPSERKYIDSLSESNIELFVNKHKNGLYFANPVFDGANEDGIKEKLALAGLPTDGQTYLFDGQTGEVFDQRVTVGVMYILKLHHLVDEKIHARSTGPYSLVTQQPLGGKAQFGGQRLGEMEVWALEAYGAAHILREFLTVKSDDIIGRDRMYEAIVKGENILKAETPEAFNVLLKELEALCLKIERLDKDSIVMYEDSRRQKLTEIIMD